MRPRAAVAAPLTAFGRVGRPRWLGKVGLGDRGIPRIVTPRLGAAARFEAPQAQVVIRLFALERGALIAA